MNLNLHCAIEPTWRYGAAQNALATAAFRLRLLEHRLKMSWRRDGNDALKRGFDVFCCGLGLLLLSPLFLLVALLIKLEDGGPVLFVQTRVGHNGREFPMYKFRSMVPDAEKRFQELLHRNEHREGITFKIKDDPRVTRIGKWLRKLSLDELPQLYNVLVGDMSLVGPRPPVPREVALYSLEHRRRLAVKPGITCIWQISGRSELDFSQQVRLDVLYIDTQTFGMDLKILLRTVPVVLAGRGAC